MHGLLIAGGFVENLLRDLGVNPKVLGVQICIFVFTFAVLSKLLFGRVLGFLHSREEEMAASEKQIKEGRHELEKLTKEFEGHIARIEKQAYDQLNAGLKETVEARAKIVGDAQLQAADEVKKARAEIAREKSEARAALKAEILVLSRQAAERVIGVPIDPAALEGAVKSSAARIA